MGMLPGWGYRAKAQGSHVEEARIWGPSQTCMETLCQHRENQAKDSRY